MVKQAHSVDNPSEKELNLSLLIDLMQISADILSSLQLSRRNIRIVFLTFRFLRSRFVKQLFIFLVHFCRSKMSIFQMTKTINR